MTSFSAPNVKVLLTALFSAFLLQVVSVEGNFDDCQRLVKAMFKEKELAEFLKYSSFTICT